MTWESDLIIPGSEYGSIRRQAAEARARDYAAQHRQSDLVHGLTHSQMNSLHSRMNEMMPRMATTDAMQQVRSLFDDTLPKGATWDARRTAQAYGVGGMYGMPNMPGGSGGAGGHSMYTVQRPYQPEFESPDRQQYPVHRILANRYWRLFIKLDPIIGTGLDMYSEMAWSDCKLTGEGVEGEVRDVFESMWETCNVLTLLPAMTREFLGIGEVVSHCFPGDQLVLTSDGYRRIDTLKKNDLVVTHLGSLEPVLDVFVREYNGIGYEMRLGKLGAEKPIRCTKEHPFYVWSKKCACLWKRAVDVHVGDYVAVQVDRTVQDVFQVDLTSIEAFSSALTRSERICPRRQGVLPNLVPINESFMRLAGYYFANGYVTQDGVRFTFNSSKTRSCEDIQADLLELFNLDSTSYAGGENYTHINVNSVPLREVFLHLFGTGAFDKRVPAWFLRLPAEKQRAFIVGVERGDGHLSLHGKGKYEAVLGLVNEQAIRSIWTMLLRLNVPASFTRTKTPKGGNGPVWWCKFGTGAWNGLTRQIWPEAPSEVGTVEQVHPFYRIVADVLFYRLESKSEIHISEPVYNCEVREESSYVVQGIAVHNCFFDDAEGMWTYIAVHNPDNLEVIDAPFIKMEPLVEFIPDDRLRAILTSSDPDLQKIREKMPPELISKLYSRQNIKINTDVNATFISRRLHPYETRGTSILSRMWRILMYEDAIFNASIATARRHAGPIKIAKLGNPQTNWIPGPEQERRFAELVAQAELDPHAWIIYHYGVQLEAFGTTERVMTINREWEIIERIKLAAMGISRSFLTGELTFASATAGLQVFLRRLLALRNFFETVWLRPKFFKPISEINQFYRRDKAELDHRIRVKRTAQEIRDQHRLIVPKIDWANKLNPMVDKDLISAYESLERLGLRISKTKKMASVNLQFEEELRRGLEEDKYENALRKEYGDTDEAGDPAELAKIIQHTDESLTDEEKGKSQGGEGGSGGAEKPKSPFKQPPPPNPMAASRTAGAETKPDVETDSGKSYQPGSVPWDERNEAWGWRKEDVEGLTELLTTGDTDSAFWSLLGANAGQQKAPDQPAPETPYSLLQAGDPDSAWLMVDEFLQEQGYPDKDIQALQRILMAEKLLPVVRTAALERFLNMLPDDTAALSDKEFGEHFAKALETKRPFVDRAAPARFLARPDNFLVGEESAREMGRRGKQGSLISDGLSVKEVHSENCACCSKIAIQTPKFDPPSNHATREEWQRGLQHSNIPQDAKNFIKQIENEFTDGWMASFDSLWSDLEKRLDNGQRLESNTVSAIVSDQIRKQVRSVDLDQVTNAFTGLYSEGKDYAYRPTGFRKKKLEILRKRSSRTAFVREAITIDTHEDKLMLDHIKQTALQKVKTITNQDMLQSILQGLTEPGASNKNPLQLADEIVRTEADKRRLQTDYYDKESRETLKNQLRDLYEDQLWKVQRIMRTEAVNGFVVAQLQGYKEQGIVKVMWNSHHDERVCPKCRALDGTTFEIDELLANGNRYPISTESHPNCRCWMTPVISYVTFDQFTEQWDKTHPKKFVQGEPVFDETKLTPEDVIQDELGTKLTTFSKVPVEHVEPLETAVKSIELSPYADSAPKKVEFVRDVADTDAFQSKASPTENMAGQVVSWHDAETDTSLFSGYAAEYDKIGDIYMRDWLQRVWVDHPDVQGTWTKLYERTPDRATIPSIDPLTASTLKTELGVYPIGQTYYTEKGEAVGLTKKFRELSDDNAKKRLKTIGIPKDDIKTIVMWRRSVPLWLLKSGDAIAETGEDEDSKFITFEASLSPQAFFRESCISYVNRPWPLLQRDPDLYATIRDKIFGGKEFR